ncbi:hypothetical protein D3C72_1919310 [compost metagenome]
MPQLDRSAKATGDRRENSSPSAVTLTALRVGNPLNATNGGASRPSTASTAARPIGPRLNTTSMKLPTAKAKAKGTDNWCHRV